jgi:hypothetical protein
MKTSVKVLTALGCAGILSLAGLGIASAAIPDNSGTIHACYKVPVPRHGAPLQVIDTEAGGTCGGGYAPLTWNAGPAHLSETVETAQMQAFGLPGSPGEPYATATCPSGTTVTGGGVQPPQDGQVLATYPTSDGTGWFGQEYGGPAGGVGTVYVECASVTG